MPPPAGPAVELPGWPYFVGFAPPAGIRAAVRALGSHRLCDRGPASPLYKREGAPLTFRQSALRAWQEARRTWQSRRGNSTSHLEDAHAQKALRSCRNEQPARPLLDRKQRPCVRPLLLPRGSLDIIAVGFLGGDRDPLGTRVLPASSARGGREPAGGEHRLALCLT